MINNDYTVETTKTLNLDFSKSKTLFDQNVIPVAVQNADTKEVILIAYTNEAAFMETVRQRKAVFWSTSKNELWYKGKTSGNTFTVNSIYVNCEQNSLVYSVTPDMGNICHTDKDGAANNCFYRELDMKTMRLVFI